MKLALKAFSKIVCVLACASSIVLAQVPGDLGSRFARATITENEKPLLMATIFKDTSDNLIVLGAPLADVIARAYGVQPYQVVGAPDWVYEAHMYDIEAVPPPAALVKADDTQMLRSLLADRFGLRMYRGTQEVTIPVLTADLGMQRALAARAIPSQIALYATRRRIINLVLLGGPRPRFMMRRVPGVSVVTTYTPLHTGTLIGNLIRATHEPVLDLTGLATMHVINAAAVLPLPGNLNLEQMTGELEESGLTLERRPVRMNVIAVTSIERPRLDVVDR